MVDGAVKARRETLATYAYPNEIGAERIRHPFATRSSEGRDGTLADQSW
jgi:hypothetical protein